MIANTRDTAPVFITTDPDWTRPVNFILTWETDVSQSFSDMEQRANRRAQASYAISYRTGPLDQSEWARHRAEMRGTLGAPVVVPIWTHLFRVVSEASDGTYSRVEINTATEFTPFKAGSYAYFGGDIPHFRKIVLVGETSLVFADGVIDEPDIEPPEYAENDEVYPCILGIRNENSTSWSQDHLDATEELIHVEEIGRHDLTSVFVSGPVIPALVESEANDVASMTVGVLDGEYVSTVQPEPVATDIASMSVGVLDGEYELIPGSNQLRGVEDEATVTFEVVSFESL